jgi:hypothetical protein
LDTVTVSEVQVAMRVNYRQGNFLNPTIFGDDDVNFTGVETCA